MTPSKEVQRQARQYRDRTPFPSAWVCVWWSAVFAFALALATLWAASLPEAINVNLPGYDVCLTALC